MQIHGTRKQINNAIIVIARLKPLFSSYYSGTSTTSIDFGGVLTIASSSRMKMSSSMDSKSALIASHSAMNSSSVG